MQEKKQFQILLEEKISIQTEHVHHVLCGSGLSLLKHDVLIQLLGPVQLMRVLQLFLRPRLKRLKACSYLCDGGVKPDLSLFVRQR